ncbi:hypothetical protein [Haladaptatus sp. ZSTT2]|uniref:hypothetical protein n=1 Tax=Haladaptatus sp. ZSTT2 TaxID=3120515 RepID=UPI00300E880C
MRLRDVLLLAVVVSTVAFAGCTGAQGTASPTTEPTSTTATKTTETTTESTSDTPEYGDELLSLMEVDNATAMKANASQRANFSDLYQREQAVFLEAYNCSCNVEQEIFRFHSEHRFDYVRFNGQWYFIRVSIV